MASRIRLVAFDLDGTLVRGDTVVQTLAKAMGHVDRAHALETFPGARTDREGVRFLREQIAACYRGASADELCGHLERLTLAPGAREGFALLRRAGIETGIVTFTWEFAVSWVARRLGADHWLGTRILPDGTVDHVWAEDKSRWLADLIARRGYERDETAAVGDSWRDLPMFEVVAERYFVGEELPDGLDAFHVPSGDIHAIARRIVRS